MGVRVRLRSRGDLEAQLSAPMPEMIVWLLSSSVCTRKVGSSWLGLGLGLWIRVGVGVGVRFGVRVRVGVKVGSTLVNRPNALPKPVWLRSLGMSARETTGSGTCIEVSE